MKISQKNWLYHLKIKTQNKKDTPEMSILIKDPSHRREIISKMKGDRMGQIIKIFPNFFEEEQVFLFLIIL